jgi:Berberine and berberine like
VAAHVEIVKSAMSGWAARQTYLNMTETEVDPARFWSPEAYNRLRRIKAAVDPGNMIRANHPVPPVELEIASGRHQARLA